MRHLFILITAALAIVDFASANCGCLKCSDHLTVVSPPHVPCKVIYRHPHREHCHGALPVEVQVPLVPPPVTPYIPKNLDYKINGFYLPTPHHDCYPSYPIEVQAPLIPPPIPPTFLTGLRTLPDRVVMDAPSVCINRERPCKPIFPDGGLVYPPVQVIHPVPQTKPIFEKLTPASCGCDDRYHCKHRSKREIPILKESIDLIMGLLPNFIKLPIRQTLKTLKLHQKISNEQAKRYYDKRTKKYHPLLSSPNCLQRYQKYLYQDPTLSMKQYGRYLDKHKKLKHPDKEPYVLLIDASNKDLLVPPGSKQTSKQESLLNKLQKLNEDQDCILSRHKRSAKFDGTEMLLPFLQVTDIENHLDSDESDNDSSSYDSDQEEESSEENYVSREIVGKRRRRYQQHLQKRQEFLQPFNVDQLFPHNPLFYILNAPIRLLHQFHKFGQQISPVFRSMPKVLVNSRKYLKDFGRNFKNDVLNFASDMVGDFDQLGTNHDLWRTYPGSARRRYRRNLNNNMTTDAQSEYHNPPLGLGSNMNNMHTPPEVYESQPINHRHERDFYQDLNLENILPSQIGLDLSRNSSPGEYAPEYSLVFNASESQVGRPKRYILKVVDEEEVQDYLQEKLGPHLMDQDDHAPRTKTKRKDPDKNSKRQKLVVEKLSSKLIIDNNGRPFVEINGVKRPLYGKLKTNHRHKDKKDSQSNEDVDEVEQDISKRINNIIKKAEESQADHGHGPKLSPRNEICVQVIREKVAQTLDEIQHLITMDFNRYSQIHNDLNKLQNFKDCLVDDWRKMLMDPKSNQVTCRIRLLNDFQEMQTLKDAAVKNIAAILDQGGTFMFKKLIKMLVRLQKLQCVIFRVVEDFGEKIKMETSFDVRKEIKYVDFLRGLHFVQGRTKSDLEKDLKEERDKALDNELKLLERLRQMLEEHHEDSFRTYEEAQLLWQIKNIEKLQKDTVKEMNQKICQGQKVRKELKILFDLSRQLENCEEKQNKLLAEIKIHGEKNSRKYYGDQESLYHNKHHHHQNHNKYRKAEPVNTNKHNGDRHWFSHTFLEDKRPVKFVTNGYTLTGYKVSDNFG